MCKKSTKKYDQLFKKSSLILILSMACVFTSCGLGNIPVKEAISSNNNLDALPYEQSYINNNYLSLLDIIERMSAFEEEATSIPLSDGITPEATKDWVEDLKPSLERQQQLIDRLYVETLDLLKNKITIDNYLYYLLNERYTYLVNREEQIVNDFKSKGILVTMTSKDLMDFLDKNDYAKYYYGKSYTKKELILNEQKRLIIVRRYELLQLLIREAYKLCNISELSQETLELLSISVKLQPILTGISRNLGHPDETGNAYTLLENICFANEETSLKLLNLWDRCCSISERVVKLKESKLESADDDKIARAIHAFFSYLIESRQSLPLLEEFFKKKQNKLEKEILRVKEKLDLPIYKEYLSKKHQPLKLRNLVTPIDQTRPLKSNQDNPILPTNDSLLFGNSQVQVADKPKKREIAKQPSQPVIQEEKPVGRLTSLEKQEESRIADNIGTQEGTIIEKTKEEEKDEEKPMVSTKNDAQAREQKEQVVSELNNRPFQFDQWDLPKGLVSFHAKMFSNPHPSVLLRDNKKQDIVDRLFDDQRQCNVTFKEFKSVWEYIGGSIYCSHGGSHRELIDSREETLFGIFAHNENQTYGKKSVKYLQTGFLYVGLRPMKWSNN